VWVLVAAGAGLFGNRCSVILAASLLTLGLERKQLSLGLLKLFFPLSIEQGPVFGTLVLAAACTVVCGLFRTARATCHAQIHCRLLSAGRLLRCTSMFAHAAVGMKLIEM
jgi:hypothetical protein